MKLLLVGLLGVSLFGVVSAGDSSANVMTPMEVWTTINCELMRLAAQEAIIEGYNLTATDEVRQKINEERKELEGFRQQFLQIVSENKKQQKKCCVCQ